MMHIAINSNSVRNPSLGFTAPGLGDRIHIITTAWCLARYFKTKVTIHLTSDKFVESKKDSFEEILQLFPKNEIYLQCHPVSRLSEAGWISYLKIQGIDAINYWYKDHPGWYEEVKKIDISEYIKTIPLLTTKNRNFINKESCNYVTSQWDSSGKNRQIDNNARKRIIDKYVKMGYEVVTIGGEAENDELKYSLKHIAHVISNAKLHIGVDSGFMHLAQLYLPATNLHIYHERKGWWSHHILRLIDNGGILNQYYIRISIFDRLLNRMRYDSKISRRFICFFMRGKNDNK